GRGRGNIRRGRRESGLGKRPDDLWLSERGEGTHVTISREARAVAVGANAGGAGAGSGPPRSELRPAVEGRRPSPAPELSGGAAAHQVNVRLCQADLRLV